MPTTPMLKSLRSALQALPVDWVLWSVDAEGVILVHEGPGIVASGMEPRVGRSVWEAYRQEGPILAFAARVLREPAAAELESGGFRFHVAGTPLASGGAVGMALVLGRARERSASDPPALPSVVELLRPVPEIDAVVGDLLLLNPERPGVVGLYREMPASLLPAATLRDLRLIHSLSVDGHAPSGPAPAGAARPLRERAAHLRLVP